MQRSPLSVCAVFLVCAAAFGQPPAASPALPKLEKFEASMIDKSKDACTDFYQYTCSKWVASHPIPADMPSTSVSLPLFLYNQTILKNAMEKAAADPQAKGSERQIGDFWKSCMDESGRKANGKAWLKPHLATIESLKSKKDLSRVISYLHLNFPATWQGDDNSTKAPLFGFGPQQDLE